MGPSFARAFYNRMKKIIEYKKIRGVYMRVDPTNQVIRISAPYGFPTEEIDRMVEQKREWIDRQLAKASVRTLPDNAEDILRERLQRLIPLYEKRMGLHAASYTIRGMKTRWGSCTPQTGRLCLNLQLAAYPEACLEYVLVHELAHLRIPNHSPAFWKLVEEYIPNWREIRSELRG